MRKKKKKRKKEKRKKERKSRKEGIEETAKIREAKYRCSSHSFRASWVFLRVRRGSIVVSRALVDGWSTTSVPTANDSIYLESQGEFSKPNRQTQILKESVLFDRGIQKELVGERDLDTIDRILVDLGTLAIYGGL